MPVRLCHLRLGRDAEQQTKSDREAGCHRDPRPTPATQRHRARRLTKPHVTRLLMGSRWCVVWPRFTPRRRKRPTWPGHSKRLKFEPEWAVLDEVEIRPLRHAGAIAILTAATSCGRIGYDVEGADIRDGAGQVPTPDVSIDDSGNAADGYDSTRGNADQGSNDAAGDASTYFDANDAPGCAGLAASLDGTEYADVARIMQDDFTIEAWIRTTSIFSGTGAWDGAPIFWADVPGVMANDFSMSILDGLVAITVG